MDSRASKTRGRVKITPREKRRHAAGREKNVSLPAACRLFTRGVIFTRARVSLALLSLRKNGGLLVVYSSTETWKIFTNKLCQFFFAKADILSEKNPYSGKHLFVKQELITRAGLRVQDFGTGKNFCFNQWQF